MNSETRPLRFRIYFGLLAASLIAYLVVGFLRDKNVDNHILAFAAFTVLLALAERTVLSYYDGDVRWGLSPSEASLVPMLFVLSPTQVVIAAALAMSSIVEEWRDPWKHGFNVAQYGCAAGAAALVFNWLQDPATSFGLRDAGAAIVAAALFSVLTQLFVGLAIHLAGQGRVADAFGDVRSTIVVGLTGSLVLGLFAAAAYAAAPWMLLLFPVAIAGLHAGYRAIARQTAERHQIERLHEAGRSLTAGTDLPTALTSFLNAVAEVLSATGARTIVETRNGLKSSAVHGGDNLESMQLADSAVGTVLNYVRETRRPLLFGPDNDPIPEALSGAASRNLVAVPIIEDGEVTGLLIASDRVGAGEFDEDDIRLLEALAGDLALSLQSYRLFEAVAEERERFQLLVESVTDYAIYMLDPQGHVVSWNSGAERIFGYAADEILGRHFSTFYPPETQAACQDELAKATLTGRAEAEGQRVRRDGSLFLANGVITPVHGSDGRITGFAKVTRDVTELVQAEAEKAALQEQLHQAQRLESVGQLAGGVAHDFNNLLSVITNATSFAMERLPDKHAALADLADVKTAATRATDLTRQLLIFSRRDFHKPQAVNLNEVIRQALKLLTRALGERVVVQSELHDSIGLVQADPGQLEQVLMNLAINARDAMPGGGTVTIETAPENIDAITARQYVDLAPGPYVRLTVSDTGKGMDPSVMQKAFDPFFTTKPKGSGTGLGLATVYGIVKGARGHINVMSSEGLGTSFEIFLPVTDALPEKAPEVTDAPGSIQLDSEGECILLVEDDEPVRTITRRVLERRGYSVLEATGSKEALQVLNNGGGAAIDLLLTDIVMPEMTGVELAHRARRMRPTLKIIYMSGYSSGVFSSGGAELEGELIQKPFDQDDLLTLVRSVLDTRPGVHNDR